MAGHVKHPDERVRKRLRRKVAIRKYISGTAERPRLSVFRSAKHIYAQAIDDTTGAVLAAASDLEAAVKAAGEGKDKKGRAREVGKAIGAKLLAKQVTTVSSTATATSTTAASPRSPMAPARPVSRSEAGGLSQRPSPSIRWGPHPKRSEDHERPDDLRAFGVSGGVMKRGSFAKTQVAGWGSLATRPQGSVRGTPPPPVAIRRPRAPG